MSAWCCLRAVFSVTLLPYSYSTNHNVHECQPPGTHHQDLAVSNVGLQPPHMRALPRQAQSSLRAAVQAAERLLTAVLRIVRIARRGLRPTRYGKRATQHLVLRPDPAKPISHQPRARSRATVVEWIR